MGVNSAVLRGLIKRDFTPTGFVFFFGYGLDDNFDNFIQAELSINSPGRMVATAQVGDLEEGTTYFYRLRAIIASMHICFFRCK